MPLKRALVECAVLSLQDSCVFYPCCKGCFSRIDADSQENRLSCSRCGYRCAPGLLDHRYRLSVRVARGSCVFGVTVFGNCLNQFFGINASGLQRLVSDQRGALESSKSALLVKAVEECFIGKHFIFGIKVTEGDHEPWVENEKSSGFICQLVATQMMLPKATGLRGRTVLSYYEAVLQKNTQQCVTDDTKAAKPKEEPQGPFPYYLSTPGFANNTPLSSGFLSQSILRFQHMDRSLSLTPPWQQSLGLITSSAEQEENSTNDSKAACFNETCRRSITPPKTWLTSPKPAQKAAELLPLQVNNFSSSEISKSILMDSPALDEFPLSESLTEFLKDRNNFNHSPRNKQSLQSAHDDIDCLDGGIFSGGYSESKTAATNNSTEAGEDEQSENSFYNCSADLFSNSPCTAATLPASKDVRVADQLQTRSTMDSSSFAPELTLPENVHYKKSAKGNLRDSFHIQPNFDFIPPSQSTPAENITMRKGKCLRSNLLIRPRGESVKEIRIHQNKLCVTPKSRFSNPDTVQNSLLKRKNLRASRGVLKSTVFKRRSSGFGGKDNALIVPPTPVRFHKTLLFKDYKKESPDVTFNKDNFQIEGKSDCKSPECVLTVDESGCNAADEECNWSRDLFSDSV